MSHAPEHAKHRPSEVTGPVEAPRTVHNTARTSWPTAGRALADMSARLEANARATAAEHHRILAELKAFGRSQRARGYAPATQGPIHGPPYAPQLPKG